MATRKHPHVPELPDATALGARGKMRRPVPEHEHAPAPSGSQALRALQRQVGNRAVARLLGVGVADEPALATTPGGAARVTRTLTRGGDGAVRRAPAGPPSSRVQRLLAVKDPEGAEYTAIDDPGFISEARVAVSEHLSAIEAADYEDFPGVYGNYLENSGVFGHYLTQLYNSGKNYGTFDLGNADQVIELYFHLKKLVMSDVGAEEGGPTEAPVDPDFAPDKILFASMSGGKVGSIYFPIGRIRLTHPSGPEISKHANIQRFTISEQDYERYDNYKKYRKDPRYEAHYRKWKTGLEYVTQRLGSCKPASPGSGERLVEFWTGGSHPSRGGPEAFNWALNQAQVNIIYNAATTGKNATLRSAMAGDRLLSQIPIN